MNNFLLIFALAYSFLGLNEAQNCNVNYRGMNSKDKTTLNQKIKTCGCPTKNYKVTEYAVYSPTANQVRKAGVKIKSDTKSVILVRTGWAWDFKSCSRVRIWTNTGADGELYELSEEKLSVWRNQYIDGEKVNVGFSAEY
jgi:hypothetical protein